MRRVFVITVLGGLGCAPTRPCGASLWHTGSGAEREVVAVGAWNRWDPGADPLREVHPGAWTTRVEPEPGDYPYMFQVDGKPVRDLHAPLLQHDPDGGPERSVLRIEDCSEPILVVDTLRASAQGAVDGLVRFLRGAGGPRLDPTSVTAQTLTGHRLSTQSVPSRGDIELRAQGLPSGKHTVVVHAADEDGATTTLRMPLWVEDTPHTWADGLVYQVMIDRFADASGALDDDPAAIGLRAGGTLAGVQAQLDAGWFDELGVSTLWLSPVYPVPDGTYPTLQNHQMAAYHGYWPITYEGVEPSIGTEDDLVEHRVVAFPNRHVPVENIVVELPGTGTGPGGASADEVLHLTAHFDVFHTGADDNTSGVVSALEAVRILRDLELSRSIQVIFYDMEETGIDGSLAWWDRYGDHKVHAVVNLDAIAYASDRPGSQTAPPGFRLPSQGDFILGLANGAASHHVQWMTQLSSEIRQSAPFMAVYGPSDNEHPATSDFHRSDHSPAWARGVPGVFMTDTANLRNPHYHQSTDLPDTLDPDFHCGVTRLVVGSVAAFAEAP